MKVHYINLKEDKKWKSWKEWEECTKKEKEQANLRQIKPNEIVLDLENREYKKLLNKLERV